MMVRFRNVLAAGVAALLGLAGADIPAPPAIAPDGIVNAASRLPATWRGGAIARGARFTIPGVRLGPDLGVRGSESDPPAKLANVSVRVAQRDAVVDAGLLFVSATRIDAWMPENAPLGDVQLKVTYQGRTSEPYELTLVPSSTGFFSSETAPEALPGAKSKPEAAPGDTVTLWSTGLGDATPDLFVGGKPAEAVHAAAAACCKGVEHAARAGFVVLARVSIDIRVVPHSGSQFEFDYGIGSFGRQESGQRVFPPLPPPHTCTVFTARINLRQIMGQARSPAAWTSIPEKTPGN